MAELDGGRDGGRMEDGAVPGEPVPGQQVEIMYNYLDGTLEHPEPFKKWCPYTIGRKRADGKWSATSHDDGSFFFFKTSKVDWRPMTSSDAPSGGQ